MARKFVMVLGITAVFMAVNVFAAEAPAKPKKPEAPVRPVVAIGLDGTVSVTKDANNVVSSITLTAANKAVYNVTLDKEGEKLGGLDGKEIKAKCVITEKEGKKWIQVLEFKMIEKKKETPAAEPKPAPKPKK